MAKFTCDICGNDFQSRRALAAHSEVCKAVKAIPGAVTTPEQAASPDETKIQRLGEILEGKLNQRIADVATNFVGRFDQIEAKLNKSLSDVEGRLAKQLETGLAGLEQRLGDRATNASQQAARDAVAQFGKQVEGRLPPKGEGAGPADGQSAQADSQPAADGQNPLGLAVARFLNVGSHLLESATLSDIVGIFRPPPSPELQAGQLLGMSLRLADKITKLEKGQETVGGLTTAITEALTPPRK